MSARGVPEEDAGAAEGADFSEAEGGEEGEGEAPAGEEVVECDAPQLHAVAKSTQMSDEPCDIVLGSATRATSGLGRRQILSSLTPGEWGADWLPREGVAPSEDGATAAAERARTQLDHARLSAERRWRGGNQRSAATEQRHASAHRSTAAGDRAGGKSDAGARAAAERRHRMTERRSAASQRRYTANCATSPASARARASPKARASPSEPWRRSTAWRSPPAERRYRVARRRSRSTRASPTSAHQKRDRMSISSPRPRNRESTRECLCEGTKTRPPGKKE